MSNVNVATLTATLRANTGQFTAAMNGAQKTTAKTSAGLLGVSKSALKMTGAFTGIAGITMGLRAAGKEIVGFDKQMRNVNSLAQLSEKDFRSLEKQVLKLAGRTAKAPAELAAGLYEVVSTGFKGGEALKVLEASAKAATAGLTTTDTAVGAISGAIKAYGLQASDATRVSDILFRTVDQGRVNFEQLAQGIGPVLPVARKLGVQLHEVGAFTATLTKAGIPAADAFTYMKGSMVALIKPTDELKTVFKKLGVESGVELVKKFGSVQGGLEAISKAVGGNEVAMAKLFPEIRGMTAAFGVTAQTSREAKRDLETLAQSSGATAKALKEQSKSLDYKWRQFTTFLQVQVISAFIALTDWISKNQDQLLALGESARNALQGIASAVRPIVKFFVDHPKMIAIAVAAWAAYKASALLATAATKAALVAQWAGLAAPAAASGAASGAAFGAAFRAKALGYFALVFAAWEGYKWTKAITGGDLSAAPGEPTTKGGKFKSPTLANAEKLAKGSTTASKIMNYFMGIGYSKEAAAGFVGNFMQESGLRADDREPNGIGLGIAQWSFGRRKQLEAFAKNQGKSPTDLSVQLAFAGREVSGDARLHAALQKAKTPQEAARIIETMYERPKAGPTANSGGRQQWAAQAFAGTISKINATKNAAKQTTGIDIGGGGVLDFSGGGGGKSKSKTDPRQSRLSTVQGIIDTLTARGQTGWHGWTNSKAEQEILKVTAKARKGGFGDLGHSGDLQVLQARRAAQDAITQRKDNTVEKAKALRSALNDIASTLKDRVQTAVSNYRTEWEKTTGKVIDAANKQKAAAQAAAQAQELAAFDSTTQQLLANTEVGRRLQALREQEAADERAQQQQRITDAYNTAQKEGDSAGMAAAQREQAAFDRTQVITQLEQQLAAEQTRIEDERAAQRKTLEEQQAAASQALQDEMLAYRVAAEDQAAAAFEASLQRQLDAEYASLQTRAGSYAAFVAQIQKILGGLGLEFESSDSHGTALAKKKTKKRALGGMTFGRTLVGEHGPEIADFPVGTRIYNADDTRQMMGQGGGSGGNSYSISVSTLDGRSAATEVVRAIDEFERRNGQRFARA